MSADRDRHDTPAGAEEPLARPSRDDAPPWQPTPPTPAEIRAELADHLALAADQVARSESTRGQAEDRARRAFGSLTWTFWHCWWIGHREEAMFRGAVVLLLGVIGLALGGVAYQGWQMQRVMAVQLASVTSDLGELARQQADWIRAQQDPARQEIRGRVFRGDASRPAADVEITVRQLPNLEVVRRLRSDEDGTYRTGRLPEGAYCVLAPLVGDVKNPYLAGSEDLYPGASGLHPIYGVQSRPLSVPGDDLTVELDVDMPVGTIELAMDDPVPAAVGPEGALPLTLVFSLVPLDQVALPWRLEDELPGDWPVKGFLLMPGFWTVPRSRFFAEQPAPWSIDLSKRLVGERGTLLAGRYWFRVWSKVSFDRLRASPGLGYGPQAPKPLPDTPEVARLRRLYSDAELVLGVLPPESRALPREAPAGATVITLRPGGRLRLKVAAPTDYLEHVAKVLTLAEPSNDDIVRLKQSDPLRVTVEELPSTAL